MPPPPTVVCFGEALWDVLPQGIFPGGAPLNVAYHLSRHDVRSVLVTAVGRDFLGDEILRRARRWQIDVRPVARSGNRPTGTVTVELDPRRNAHYRIARQVAWDRIDAPRAFLRRTRPAALVFGTLALRERANRDALGRLVAAWPNALRVVDLNLRPPFDADPATRFALRHAQLLKLNHDELARQIGRRPSLRRLERDARELGARHRLTRVCVTAGAAGAGLLWNGAWIWQPARRVAVRDTIGAGDAFLGSFLAAILREEAPASTALARACRIAEFVASQDGATPDYTPAAIHSRATASVSKFSSPACSMPEIED